MRRSMKKKRPKRSVSKKPPPARGSPRRVASKAKPEAPGAPAQRMLQYKVIELSTVDEGTLERALNEWSLKGWTLDGVQFAMRDSSKRPAMAFVLFTREVEASKHPAPESDEERPLPARGTWAPPSASASVVPLRTVSADERLRQLAESDDSDEGFVPTTSGADRWLEPDPAEADPDE
jgi:hypothetical protein